MFRFYYPCGDIWLPQCSINKYTHCRNTLTHTHTHTHTHVGFYGLRGLSIGVMVVILYKLYVLLPYTYPTPKLSPHRRRCISTFPPKNSLCMIYKCFELWGHWKCPHKSPSPCNTYVIPMSLYIYIYIYIYYIYSFIYIYIYIYNIYSFMFIFLLMKSSKIMLLFVKYCKCCLYYFNTSIHFLIIFLLVMII